MISDEQPERVKKLRCGAIGWEAGIAIVVQLKSSNIYKSSRYQENTATQRAMGWQLQMLPLVHNPLLR